MTILWSSRAVEDLVEIGKYIATDDRRVARLWVARLKERTAALALSPGMGRQVPELGRDDVRELIEGNYRIVYRTTPAAVEILPIFEGHRTLRLDPPPSTGSSSGDVRP